MLKLKELMTEKTILIGSIENGKKLSKIANKFEQDIDIVTGRYIIDAKSILGIFSLNLWSPVTIVLHSDDQEVVKSFITEIKDFIVEER